MSRAGCEYRVSLAAEMDMYPKCQPWVFVDPRITAANERGKLCVNLSWQPETSRFADVVMAVIAHVEAVHGASSGADFDNTAGVVWVQNQRRDKGSINTFSLTITDEGCLIRPSFCCFGH